MIRLLRILGITLIVLGILVILTWLIEPLRDILPMTYDWFRSLPPAMQIGLGIAAVGFLLLFSSVVWERLEDRKNEADLLDD